ncbi:MAG: hypothetical protein HQL54_06560 [Magnetococcales bacterium]|nr:hypothetical protein [Magnetococcales bacterium]
MRLITPSLMLLALLHGFLLLIPTVTIASDNAQLTMQLARNALAAAEKELAIHKQTLNEATALLKQKQSLTLLDPSVPIDQEQANYARARKVFEYARNQVKKAQRSVIEAEHQQANYSGQSHQEKGEPEHKARGELIDKSQDVITIVNTLLAKAEDALANDRLSRPSQHNVLYYLKQVRNYAPDHPQLRTRIKQILEHTVDRYITLSKEAKKKGQSDTARTYSRRAIKLADRYNLTTPLHFKAQQNRVNPER